MIELKFYRDDEYVYINNPDGTTKRVAIEDFENTFNVDTAELPTYTSSDAGKVLVVNSDGTGLEWGESGASEHKRIVGTLSNDITVLANNSMSILEGMMSFEDLEGNVAELPDNYIVSGTGPGSVGLVLGAVSSQPLTVLYRNITASDITLRSGKLICELMEM